LDSLSSTTAAARSIQAPTYQRPSERLAEPVTLKGAHWPGLSEGAETLPTRVSAVVMAVSVER
jgi:hypothetical protein